MTTYIASFDIGKKNFAFYVEEVNIDVLEKMTSIPKNKRYNVDGTPKDEFQTLISNVYLTGNKILYKNLDLTEGTKKEKYLDSLIYHNMIEALDTYKDVFDKCSIIVIEQQMSFKNAQNTMALKLAQHLHSYFIFRYPITKCGNVVIDDSKEVVEFPAYYKTQVLGAPKVGGKSMSKPQRKKWATEKAMDILMERGDTETLEEIEGSKKKDDLADTLIQLQSFKFLRFVDKFL
jgi:hypothetical protein